MASCACAKDIYLDEATSRGAIGGKHTETEENRLKCQP